MLSQDSLFYWKGPQTTLLVERMRGHHVVPRCKGGTETVPTCHSCEDFIHKTWSHKELRDTFNTVEKIQADPLFQKFLRWLYKQQPSAFFRTRRNRSRTSQPTADRRALCSMTLLVSIAQNTERARPKRQVAGESPAGGHHFPGA